MPDLAPQLLVTDDVQPVYIHNSLRIFVDEHWFSVCGSLCVDVVALSSFYLKLMSIVRHMCIMSSANRQNWWHQHAVRFCRY